MNYLSEKTGFPDRYRGPWPRPTDSVWQAHYRKISDAVASGGIVGLIGNRGCGKTRAAAEIAKDFPGTTLYATAMGLFLRIKDSFDGKAASEARTIDEIAAVKLLVIDELQERNHTEWEARVLTHIIDRRYGSEAPTIIIANLTLPQLEADAGASISSRMAECGGVVDMSGHDHRAMGTAIQGQSPNRPRAYDPVWK
jgi:DNA replication protein DnaC